MADHASHGGELDAHRRTYEGFIIGSLVLAIVCGYVLVALSSFSFGHGWNVLIGFLGLVGGILAVVIDVRLGGRRWYLSLGILVVFALITAVNVS